MVIGCLQLSDVSIICRVVNPRWTPQKIWRDVLCITGQVNESELIPMKFGRQEIGKIVFCLPEKKQNKNFTWLSSCRYCTDSAQNLPGPAPDNLLKVLQISSKSVHFWRIYRRMHKLLPKCAIK